MTDILFWNVRGLNNNIRINDVKDAIQEKRLGLIGLVETKVRTENASRIARQISSSWSFLHNYLSDDHGRVWIAWNADVYAVTRGIESK